MSTEIIKVLDDLSSRFGIAIDWTSQNVIPYIQELIGRVQAYTITQNTILTVCMTAIIVVAMRWFIKLYKRHKGDDCYDIFSSMEVGLNVIFAVIGGFALMALPFAIGGLLQAIFIPELTFINQISTLMK